MQTMQQIKDELDKVKLEQKNTSFAHVDLFLEGAQSALNWVLGD